MEIANVLSYGERLAAAEALKGLDDAVATSQLSSDGRHVSWSPRSTMNQDNGWACGAVPSHLNSVIHILTALFRELS
jgi:hypothetical protein